LRATDAEALGVIRERKHHMGNAEKYLTAVEASAALAEKGIHVSPRTLMDKASAHRLPAHKPNGKRRFLLSELFEHFRREGAQPVEAEAR
jgi:hypothetical protein